MRRVGTVPTRVGKNATAWENTHTENKIFDYFLNCIKYDQNTDNFFVMMLEMDFRLIHNHEGNCENDRV